MIDRFERQEKRDDIAEAAMRLVDLLGMEKTSIADIARELKMSPDGIYRVYASKGQIYQAVARRLLGEIETVLSNVLRRRAPVKQKLKAALNAITSSHATRIVSSPKLQALLRTAYEEKWPVVDRHVQALEKSLAAIISQGVAEGAFHVEDVELAAMTVRSVCMCFCDPRLIEERVDNTGLNMDQIIDFCIAALT
jgi:AcrR family transcriptional regulator